MKNIPKVFIYFILSVCVISCNESDNKTTSEEHNSLSDRVHAQMKLVEKEMQEIKNTTNPAERKKLLAAHQPNMSQLVAVYKQLQEDKSEGASGGQSATMVDIMTGQLILYQSTMKDL